MELESMLYFLRSLLVLNNQGGSNAFSVVSENQFSGAGVDKQQLPVSKSSFGDVCNSQGCVLAAANLLSSIDESFDPCDNFYLYACNKWKTENPIPDDQTRHGRFDVTIDRVKQLLRGLFESDAALTVGDSAAVNLTRRHYRECIDTAKLAKIKSKPLFDALKKLGGWPLLGKDAWPSEPMMDLSDIVTGIIRDFADNAGFWEMGVDYDSKNVTRQIIAIDQPDMLLGSREYYLNETKYADILAAYRKFMVDVGELLAADAGLKSPTSESLSRGAEEILALETKIANLTRPPEDRRNKTELYNLWTVAELKKAVTFMNWDKYFDEILPPAVRAIVDDHTKIVVKEPRYLAELVELIAGCDSRITASYALWVLVWNNVKYLDDRFLDASQAFMKVHRGRESRPSKWKDCVETTAVDFEEATGALYVDRYFSDQDKEVADEMITQLRSALAEMIKELSWMDAQTKEAALFKLKNISPLIGYAPMLKDRQKLDEFYKELSSKVSAADGYFEVDAKVDVFAQNKEFEKLLTPTDRSEFIKRAGAAVVNAFYNAAVNSITFPAAILQPPFFHGTFPKYVNFGAIGVVIGHELTHGFDDKGSQNDAVGNLDNWWSDDSATAFRNKTQCIIDEYSSYEAPESKLRVNGKLTQGENIADNGGLKEAFKAYKAYIRQQGKQEPRLPGLNLTNEQVFFLSFATTWCGNMRPGEQVRRILSDPHSPADFRANGPLSNFDEFAKAFNCPVGSRMNPAKTDKSKCDVW